MSKDAPYARTAVTLKAGAMVMVNLGDPVASCLVHSTPDRVARV